MSKKKEVLNQKAVLVDGTEVTLNEWFTEADFVEIDDSPFIKLVALQRVAKRVYGMRGYACNVVQTPSISNEWCATVIARYELGGSEKFKEEFKDMNIIFDGAADCRDSSTSPGFDKYMVALAESRAKARALRDALGVEVCSSEEIARTNKKERSFVDANGNAKIEATQAMIIRSKFFGALGKTLEDVSEIVGRQVFNIEELTKEEAAKILEAFNKHVKK